MLVFSATEEEFSIVLSSRDKSFSFASRVR